MPNNRSTPQYQPTWIDRTQPDNGPGRRLRHRLGRSLLVLAVISGGTLLSTAAPTSADIPTQEELDASKEKEENGGYDPNPGGFGEGDHGNDHGTEQIRQVAEEIAISVAPTLMEQIGDYLRGLLEDVDGRPSTASTWGDAPVLFWNTQEFGEGYADMAAAEGAAHIEVTGGGGGGMPNPLYYEPTDPNLLHKLAPGNRPCTSPNSDSDGDGWGWEDGGSCNVVFSDVPEQGAADKLYFHIGHLVANGYTPGALAYTSGNGDVRSLWSNGGPDEYSLGYRIDGDTIEVFAIRYRYGTFMYRNVTYTATVTSQPVATPTTDGAACVDSDGDGWGWNGSASCKVESVTATSTSDVDENGRPYCSTSAADPDGDGWGWENNQSCVVR